MKSHTILCMVLSIGLILAVAPPVYAGGLTVKGGKIDVSVQPGRDYTYRMEVQNDSDKPMDICIESMGYGTSGENSCLVLEPADDVNRFTAREYLFVSPDSFHLESGESRSITITAGIPPGELEGGRYAVIFIYTRPSGGSIATISSVAARVLFTIDGSTLNHDSLITEIKPGRTGSGTVVVSVANNGNHHYRPHLTGKLMKDHLVLAVAEMTDTWPLIPGYSRLLEMDFTGSGWIENGEYEVEVTVSDESGELTACQTLLFTTEAFDASVAKPSVPASAPNLEYSPVRLVLIPSEPAVLAAKDGIVSIIFSRGAVTSRAELSLISRLPGTLPAPPQDCSLASACFEVAGLNGLLASDAVVNVRYSSGDLKLAGGDVSRFALAVWDEACGRWILLKTSVDSEKLILSAYTKQLGTMAVMVKPPASAPLNSVLLTVLAVVCAAGIWGFFLIRKRNSLKKQSG